MKVVSCILLLVVAVAAGGCDVVGGDVARSDDEVNVLISQLKKIPFPDEKIEALTEALTKSPLGFTGNQTVAIFECLGFAAWSSDSVDAMLPYILNLECENLAKLMATVPFPDDKLKMMKTYIPLTIDLKQNNATLLKDFSNSFTKEDAQKIIDEYTAGSNGSKGTIPCLFGYGIRAKRVIIVVDKSGSMGRTITNEGRVLTMLQFVGEQLNLAVDVMTDDQEFNLIYFAITVQSWQKGVVPHNAENVQNAKASIATLSPGGGTNTWGAMNIATQDPKAYAIFLLSDGQPNGNEQDIINLAFKYSHGTDSNGSPRFITAIAFNADARAASFMTEVAKAGNGTFRNLK